MHSSSSPATETLRCLSIQQPFAWAVCAGVKTVENRSWKTEHRGLIAIHAGSKKQRVTQFIRDRKKARLSTDLFAYSAIIGVAELVDVVEMNIGLEDNPSAAGEQCWILQNARLLPNLVPCKGKLRLYSLTPDETEQVRRQLPGLAPMARDGAVEAWCSVLKAPSPTLHRSRGLNYVNLGNGDDAIRSFNKAIEQNSDDDELLFRRALVWTWLMADPQKGIDDCTQALTINPKFVDALMHRADSYRALDDVANAEVDEAKAEEFDPGIVERWDEEFGDGDPEENK